jgi:tetratricopeptide (TPR) repeat protein
MQAFALGLRWLGHNPLLVVALAMLLVGCASRNASEYHQWGFQAEQVRDYFSAELNYERALENARQARMHPANISMFEYNLGRVKGYLCKYDEAEKLMSNALAAQERIGAENRILTMRLFELGRLHFDRENYALAAPYYARGIRVATRLGSETSDPIGLADVIDEYAVALEGTGDPARAASERKKASELRDINPGKRARFVPVRYNGSCTDRSARHAGPGKVGPRSDGKVALLRLRRGPGSVDSGVGEDLAAVQLLELNEWSPPRSMWQSSEFEIAAGTNQIGLRAAVLTRFLPSQQYAYRHVCLEFVAEPERVYTVSVGSDKQNWLATVTVDEADVTRSVPALARVLPFDGNNPRPCQLLY